MTDTDKLEPGWYWVTFDGAREPEPARFYTTRRAPAGFWLRAGLAEIWWPDAIIGPRLTPPEKE